MMKPKSPNIPNMPEIGMGTMTDSLEFVKNLWGSMGLPSTGIPGMVMPTLSVEEINKKITDLRAVESWLGLNMTMLRSTIQALEVQAATLATLQSMSDTFTAAMGSGAHTAQAANGAAASPNGVGNGAGKHASETSHVAGAPTSKDQTDAASLTAPLANAAAWWGMLQEQFKQAVSNAMATEPETQAETAKPKARAKAKDNAPDAEVSGTETGTTPRKRKTTK